MTLTENVNGTAAPIGWSVTCDSAEDGHGTDHGSLAAARRCAWLAAGAPALIRYDPDPFEGPWHIADFGEHTWYAGTYVSMATPLCDDQSGDFPMHSYVPGDAERIRAFDGLDRLALTSSNVCLDCLTLALLRDAR